jgi:hypothetical protein
MNHIDEWGVTVSETLQDLRSQVGMKLERVASHLQSTHGFGDHGPHVMALTPLPRSMH